VRAVSVLRLAALGNLVVLLCLGSVLLGALYFGIASCGGYIWHRHAFVGFSVGMAIMAVAGSSTILPSLKVKIGFLIALPLLYVFVESAVAPFYPGPPSSPSEYWAAFTQAVQYGPCR